MTFGESYGPVAGYSACLGLDGRGKHQSLVSVLAIDNVARGEEVFRRSRVDLWYMKLFATHSAGLHPSEKLRAYSVYSV